MGQYISKASPNGKAVFLLHELQRGQPEEELRGLFMELAPEDSQRASLADAMEELLRQYRYAPADIWKLMDSIYPERGSTTAMSAGPASAPTRTRQPVGSTPVGDAKPPQKKIGKRTQPVKSPFLKPFDEVEPGKQQPPPEIPHPKEQQPQKAPEKARQPQQPPKASPQEQEPPPRQKPPATPPDAKTVKKTEESSKRAIGPDLRDVDKTGMFGATLKGLDVNAVRPKTKAKVLVADDDHRIRLIYRTKLEENGYSVVEAENGMEAWRLISTGEADIAVLDMKMPGYHGLDVLGRMSDAGMDAPVIISTAYDQLSDEFVVATYPRLKYLVKPVDPNALLAAVEEFYQLIS